MYRANSEDCCRARVRSLRLCHCQMSGDGLTDYLEQTVAALRKDGSLNRMQFDHLRLMLRDEHRAGLDVLEAATANWFSVQRYTDSDSDRDAGDDNGDRAT